MSDNGGHAHSQCCFTPWGCTVELLASPLGSDIFVCFMDGHFRHFPVDHSCFCINMVAIPIP